MCNGVRSVNENEKHVNETEQDDLPPVLIALGNKFRGDDGVGHYIAESIQTKHTGCRIVANQDDSMALLNAWQNTGLAIVVDAAQSGATPGTIHEIDAGNQPIPQQLARCSSHGVGLAEALELGKVLDVLPVKLLIYAVEAEQFEAGNPLSLAVKEAADQVTRKIEFQLTSQQEKSDQQRIP